MSVSDAVEYLGLMGRDFSSGNGFYGYRCRQWLNGISIHSDHPSVDGILVEMSGTGCRAFETFTDSSDWVSIFDDILHDEDFKVTRLDIAFDDHTGCIPMKRLIKDYRKCNVVSRFKSKSITREDHLGEKGSTLYFGSCQSEIRFRIYDKAFERGFDDQHWIRFEGQFRRDMALEFIRNLEKTNYDVGKVFSGVVNNYFRFVVPNKSDLDHRERWKTAPYWSALVEDVLPISLWCSKDLEYNKARCEDYVYRQAGNSVAALIELEGLSGFEEKLKKNKSKKVPDRIRNMVATEKALAEQSSDAILAAIGG